MESIVFRTQKGNPATDTRRIAVAFGKAHKTVLRAVDNLEISEEFSRHNFAPYQFTSSRGRKERAVMMTRAGFTRLVMSFTGKKAAAFKEQYIAQFDAMESELRQLRGDAPEVNLLDHARREVQVANSKSINNHQYLLGGVASVVDYNRTNCLLHTGKRPSELLAEAKQRGVRSKARTSAKELMRQEQPAVACCMSLADQLVRAGATLDQAATITTQAKQVFEGMMRLGFRPTQLSL
jgi:Rha family phage regulatory protein